MLFEDELELLSLQVTVGELVVDGKLVGNGEGSADDIPVGSSFVGELVEKLLGKCVCNNDGVLLGTMSSVSGQIVEHCPQVF